MSSSPIWVTPGEIAWNYIIISDVHVKGSNFDLYRYSNTKPATGLPKLDLVASRTFIGLEPILNSVSGDSNTFPEGSHGTPDEESYLEGLLDQLVQWANTHVPEVQRARTPIYFYGTGDAKSIKMLEDHKLLQTACSFLKGSSSFLINDCDTQFKSMDEDYEGILSWLASNYRETLPSTGLRPKSNSLLLGNSGCTTVYSLGAKEKGASHSISLPLGDGTAETYDLHVNTDDELGLGPVWDRYVASGKSSCFFAGSKQKKGKESGNYLECRKELTPFVDQVPRLSISSTWQAAGELPMIHKLVPSIAKSELICSTSWKDLDKNQFPVTDLDRLCFKSAYYRTLLGAFFPGDLTPEVSHVNGKWTLGRALLYAVDDVNKASKHSVGIQRAGMSKTWNYGAEVERPQMGNPVAGRPSSSSGGHFGLFALISLVAVVLYLFFGKHHRYYLNKFLPGRKKKLDSDVYELDSNQRQNFTV